ncbi:hypothetical protein CLI64_27595 [Nostoc sp. CENA543]|uniref:hypothetical protein n=1 Tax=Nostoc sp. CENA543 TaxID=1869241 RepID=UPI000CA1D23B|nr:hypothetical protein [Nostoc sp. CENA543]AUT03854.1 hypothetical protein CLI64_27595 [Nostoc sp. CENA543]
MIKIGLHQLSSIIPFSFISQFDKKIRTFPLVFLLLAPVSVWIVTETISPQIARAYTARVDLIIDRLPDEGYEAILRRAEMTARAAAQRSFDKDILVTDVSVIVSVQSYGAIAPILTLGVSRQQWRTRPDPRRWATYYKYARSLLRFDESTSSNPAAAVTIPQAGVNTPAATPPAPQTAPETPSNAPTLPPPGEKKP